LANAFNTNIVGTLETIIASHGSIGTGSVLGVANSGNAWISDRARMVSVAARVSGSIAHTQVISTMISVITSYWVRFASHFNIAHLGIAWIGIIASFGGEIALVSTSTSVTSVRCAFTLIIASYTLYFAFKSDIVADLGKAGIGICASHSSARNTICGDRSRNTITGVIITRYSNARIKISAFLCFLTTTGGRITNLNLALRSNRRAVGRYINGSKCTSSSGKCASVEGAFVSIITSLVGKCALTSSTALVARTDMAKISGITQLSLNTLFSFITVAVICGNSTIDSSVNAATFYRWITIIIGTLLVISACFIDIRAPGGWVTSIVRTFVLVSAIFGRVDAQSSGRIATIVCAFVIIIAGLSSKDALAGGTVASIVGALQSIITNFVGVYATINISGITNNGLTVPRLANSWWVRATRYGVAQVIRARVSIVTVYGWENTISSVWRARISSASIVIKACFIGVTATVLRVA